MTTDYHLNLGIVMGIRSVCFVLCSFLVVLTIFVVAPLSFVMVGDSLDMAG